jgi:hypothetical protein
MAAIAKTDFTFDPSGSLAVQPRNRDLYLIQISQVVAPTLAMLALGQVARAHEGRPEESGRQSKAQAVVAQTSSEQSERRSSAASENRFHVSLHTSPTRTG